MDTELYIHPKATNNNPPPVGKNKWNKGLASLEEDDETPPVAPKGRRKSWVPGVPRLERKRRTGVAQSPKYERQKRHSWWNILVPDQLSGSRSRRSSQETPEVSPPVRAPRRASEITIPHIPWLRNKSRSVDHGVHPPFDLDALRSKVEGRLDKLTRAGDPDGESGSRESLAERKMQPSVPVKTTTYKVEASDTLTSVAARFDTTPSELAILNRLPSRTVFPGQVIRVPDKSGKSSESNADDDADRASHTASTDRSEHTDDEDSENLRVSSPKPGHVERIGTPSSASPSLQRFLKIDVKHITDGQGVISGVLLVTPNAVMFDPNVSDPLVIDRGPECYGVIAPMEYVVNAAIYHDIAHMQVGKSQNRCDLPKPEVYRMKSEESEGEGESSSHLQVDSLESREHSTKDLRSSTEEDDAYWSGSVQREGDAFPKAFERDLVTPTNITSDKPDEPHTEPKEDKTEDDDEHGPYEDGVALVRALENRRKSCLDHHWAMPSQSMDKDKELDSDKDLFDKDTIAEQAGDGEFVPPIPVQPLHHPLSESSSDKGGEEEKKKQTVSFSLDEDQKKEEDKQETKKNKMLKRLSYPLTWMEGITGSDDKDSLPSSAESHPSHSSSVFSKVFSRRSSVSTFIKQQHAGGHLPSKAAPKLDYRSMVSVEDMPELFVSFDKLIPRPARSYDDPPLYLRLRMGKPKDKKIPKNTPIMSYGKKRMKPEYWYSVPRDRVDELYRFLMAWVPQLYGDLDEEVVAERGYELVDSDTELWEPDDSTETERRPSDGDLSEITRESWEVLSMSGELRRALYANSSSLDIELFLPDLVGTTEILTEDHRKQLCRHLPARAEGYVWTLVFSTSQHGFSLNSMYRKMAKIESPILMVIEDTENNVFGALTSCALKVSDHFYGTGESLLFRFAPDCQIYNWAGDNMYFIKGNNESLSIGAGDGKFGLWLDGDLYQGRTESCSTYRNEPLAPQEDFVVKTLECWAFV